MVTFKKIIEALNVNIPCEYYVVDDKQNKTNLLWLDVLSNEDKEYYSSLSEEEKRNYKTESSRIYIPKMSIYRYKNMSEEGGGYDFLYTLNRINRIYAMKIDDDCLAVAVYMILHELGHWNDLKNKSFNVWGYAIKESEESERIFYERSELGKNLWNYDEETRRKKAFDYLERCNSTPIEGRANKYADDHFEESFTLIKNMNLK